MNDEYKPDSLIVSEDSALMPDSTATLTGTTATLSGVEALSNASAEYKYIAGPDGQMYAVKQEPFIWKKFFIGLGVPLFLMIVPLILSLIAEGMDSYHDDEYETERVDLELVNGTAYAANYALDSDQNLEWCWLESRLGYSCDPQGNSVMRIYAETDNTFDLIRGNGTSYYANFSLDSNQSLAGCEIHVWTEDSYQYCDVSRISSYFRIIKETWEDGGGSSGQVGYWNATTGVIDYDDGEDHGLEIEISIYVSEVVGIWTQEEGVFHFDSGEDHGTTVDIHVETIDTAAEEERDNAQDTVDVMIGISTIMCLAAPLVSIGMIIYGFAASGGKAMGIGAIVALVSYPIIGFFGCIAALSAGW